MSGRGKGCRGRRGGGRGELADLACTYCGRPAGGGRVILFDGDGDARWSLNELRVTCPGCIPAYRSELRERLGEEFDAAAFELGREGW